MRAIEPLAELVDAVVIGTSAGGVEALSLLLPALPKTMRAAVLVVLHIPRERPSLLVDIFQPKCAVTLREAQDKESIEPGGVYFAPPDYHLLVDTGPQIVLSVDELVNFSRPSIDVLFESAADVFGNRLLGVILTGGSSDGAAGLEAVKRAGGITIVQQPDTTVASMMAESALKRTPRGSRAVAAADRGAAAHARRARGLMVPVLDPCSSPTPTLKCLLVDDLEENLLALSAVLRRDGLEVLVARSGDEALELALQHDVALAIVDVQMPEMDGFELAELLRGAARTRHVPIIFVTAAGRDQRRLFKGYETGAVDFLYKPLEPHVLRSKAEVFFELHRQKQQLVAALQQQQELLRLNEMFAGVLGHDLRTPLSAILAGASVLLSDTDNAVTREVGQRIASSGRRMARMIEDLLDLTRARLAGGIAIAPAPVDLEALVDRVVQEQQFASTGRRIEVESRGDLAGEWDPDRLAQAASNLIGNALQHGVADEAIMVRLDGSGRDDVTLSVRNAGNIPADLLPYVFDPFRTGRPSAGRGGGLGLGLFIAQQIAQAHEGSIDVFAHEPAHTTFRLTVPRRSTKIAPH